MLLAAALAGGCVSKSRYDELTAERDGLARDLERASKTAEVLDAERVALIADMEDLRQERETLDRDVAKLRTERARLSETLADREEKLAAREAELSEIRSTYQTLVQDLEAEVAAGQIEIEQLRSGLRLNVAQDILFASGSTQLNASGREVLGKVARQLAKVPHHVEVQGHTDDVPINPAARTRYPTNWELAAARATQVVRLLADGGVEPGRLQAVSFGEFHPVASNDTPEGRLRNRRIEIRLEPVEPAEAPPVADAAP